MQVFYLLLGTSAEQSFLSKMHIEALERRLSTELLMSLQSFNWFTVIWYLDAT